MADRRYFSYPKQQGLIWIMQGAAMPVLIFATVIVLVTVAHWATQSDKDFATSLALGQVMAMFGLMTSFGAIGIPLIARDGFKWRTILRIIGFFMGLVALWFLTDVWIDRL